jgi:hypothetical protein
MATNPAADLRRVTKRIAELQAQQRALIAQVGLDVNDELVVISVLELANEVDAFLMNVKGVPTSAQQRKGVTLSRRLSRASTRLDRLSESDAKAAAQAAATEATERLLGRLFPG